MTSQRVPTGPPFAYLGGKSAVAPFLAQLMPPCGQDVVYVDNRKTKTEYTMGHLNSTEHRNPRVKEDFRKWARELHKRKVIVTTRHYEDCFKWQGKKVYFVDPPYYTVKKAYPGGPPFTHDQHVALAATLANETRFWLMTIDDCPEVRELYDWAHIEKYEVE